MNITDKAALFKDLGLRLASEAAMGYPIRAIDRNIRCSLKGYRHQLQQPIADKTCAPTSSRIWSIALASIVSDSQGRSEGKIPE